MKNMALYRCLIIPAFINSKVQLKSYDRILMEKLDSQTLSYSELNRLYRRKEAGENEIREMGVRYRNILLPHVYLALENYKMF